LVALGSIHGISRGVDASAGEDEVRAAFYGACWCLVLLAELVTLARQVDAYGENLQVFSPDRAFLSKLFRRHRTLKLTMSAYSESRKQRP